MFCDLSLSKAARGSYLHLMVRGLISTQRVKLSHFACLSQSSSGAIRCVPCFSRPQRPADPPLLSTGLFSHKEQGLRQETLSIQIVAPASLPYCVPASLLRTWLESRCKCHVSSNQCAVFSSRPISSPDLTLTLCALELWQGLVFPISDIAVEKLTLKLSSVKSSKPSDRSGR